MVESKPTLRVDRLRELREQHGWSQRELARLCGFGEAQVRKYESGQTDPSATYLKLIANRLNVSTDYLLGITDNPHVQMSGGDLSEDELAMVDVFRRDGWTGVIRLAADRLAK